MATGCGSTCCGPPGAETARVIAFCNDNEGGEMTREAVQAVLDAFPQAAVMVRAYRPRAPDRARRLDLAFAERELFESAVAMGRAALKAQRHRRGTKSIGSSANIGCATASGSSGKARPATCMPARNDLRAGPRAARRGADSAWPDVRPRGDALRARWTIASTTSLWAPLPLFTWMCASW